MSAIAPVSSFRLVKPLRTLIVDDEPAAIRRLVRLCTALPTLSVVATVADGTAAVDLLQTRDRP